MSDLRSSGLGSRVEGRGPRVKVLTSRVEVASEASVEESVVNGLEPRISRTRPCYGPASRIQDQRSRVIESDFRAPGARKYIFTSESGFDGSAFAKGKTYRVEGGSESRRSRIKQRV
eukprot:3152261-Rhodomonas_salina.6